MLLLSLPGTSVADAPDLAPGVKINDSGGPIDKDIHFVPISVDWNEDGAKDLIFGQYTDGHVNLYLNQGSDYKPTFSTGSLIQSGGTPIITSFG